MLLTNFLSLTGMNLTGRTLSWRLADEPGQTRAGGIWETDPAELERRRLIEELISLNPSASVEFLQEFTTESLEEYLAHLQASQLPRGREARWRRQLLQRGIEMQEVGA